MNGKEMGTRWALAAWSDMTLWPTGSELIKGANLMPTCINIGAWSETPSHSRS